MFMEKTIAEIVRPRLIVPLKKIFFIKTEYQIL